MVGIPRGLDKNVSPWTLKAIQLMGDGEWHDRAVIGAKVGVLVPPGQALRKAERNRLSGSVSKGPRTRYLDHDQQVAVGARIIMNEMFHNRTLFELRIVNGVMQARLTKIALDRAHYSGVLPGPKETHGPR